MGIFSQRGLRPCFADPYHPDSNGTSLENVRGSEWRRVAASTAIVLLFMAAKLRADETPPPGSTTTIKPWKDTGEVSVVSANGNSRATTTSAKNTFLYHWTNTSLELVGEGMGSSSGNQVTAEQYNASEKVKRTLTGSNYVFEEGGWDKNRFAGIRDRYSASAGVGRLLMNFTRDKLTGEIGGGYIHEERTDAPQNNFPSGRAYSKYSHILSPTATFSQDAEYLHDFTNLKDYRLNMETAVIASLTTQLSLKASYTWKRVGEPPPGFGKDDTVTSVALIINY